MKNRWNLLLIIACVATCATPLRAQGTLALKEAVQGRFKMGVGISQRALRRPEDVELVLRHFDCLTPENCLKMRRVQPREGEFRFERGDAFVAFAEEHGLEVVGHNLLWVEPRRTPDWFFQDGDQPASKELVLRRLKTHIHTVAGRYKGRIKSWDVVNEALSGEEGEYLRDSDWTRLFGEEFIVHAFQYAREAAPAALLIYNDFDCDEPGKLDKLIRLVKSIRSQGGPIDAIGLQAHYQYDAIPFEGIETVLTSMRELGVKVIFSELDMDVVTRSRWYEENGKYREELARYNPYREGCPPEILQGQADQYAKLFRLIAENSDVVERVSFWNLHDGQSWLNYWPWWRSNHPLLFDRDRQPKPAYEAVIGALSAQSD